MLVRISLAMLVDRKIEMNSNIKEGAEVGGGGGRGGGSAGAGRSQKGGDLSYQRHVPKFLQAHAHLLSGSGAHAHGQGDDNDGNDEFLRDFGGGDERRKREGGGGGGDASDFDDDDEQAALRRALEENPELATVHPELGTVADAMKAADLKEKGNKAFQQGSMEEAVDLFSQCIALHPTSEVYYSNRAAAYLSLTRFSDAEKDARRVVELKPSWVKGYARLGASLLGQGYASEAREVLQKAVAMEPRDAALQTQLSKAMTQEAKDEAEQHHRFKKKREEGRKMGGGRGGGGGGGQKAVVPIALADPKKKNMLSFDDEEEDNQGD